MKPLHILKEKKQDLYKNLLLVVLLSTGISLCVNYICDSYSSDKIILWVGVVCILLVVVAYVVSFYKSKTFTLKADSLFITNPEGNLVPIDRYTISGEMGICLKSIFSENKTYESLWTSAFAQQKLITDGGDVHINKSVQDSKAINFVGELIEYIFIEWLSMQQMSYFSNSNTNKLETLDREKVAEYLLKNRVLEMISKPCNEREKFTIDTPNKADDYNGEEECYMKYYKGTLYSRFELKLPKHSSLKKVKDTLIIKNRNYTIKFKHNFRGYNTSLPRQFEKLYLKLNDSDNRVFGFQPELEIKLNPFFFLFRDNWKYMNWIDVLGEKFITHFSFKEFLNNIGYETALTSRLLAKNQPNNTIFEEIS